jgi:hypothetical protein
MQRRVEAGTREQPLGAVLEDGATQAHTVQVPASERRSDVVGCPAVVEQGVDGGDGAMSGYALDPGAESVLVGRVESRGPLGGQLFGPGASGLPPLFGRIGEVPGRRPELVAGNPRLVAGVVDRQGGDGLLPSGAVRPAGRPGAEVSKQFDRRVDDGRPGECGFGG